MRQLSLRLKARTGHLSLNRQPDRKRGAFRRFRRDVDAAAEVGHDAMDKRQAEAGAFTDALGREKWIEHALHYLRR